MTEEDDKLVTLKFAIDMRKATRAAEAAASRRPGPKQGRTACKHLNHHNERRYGEADAEHPRPRTERSHHLLP